MNKLELSDRQIVITVSILVSIFKLSKELNFSKTFYEELAQTIKTIGQAHSTGKFKLIDYQKTK